MKTIFHLFFICLFSVFSLTTFSQKIILKQTNESGIYKKGDKIKVSFLLEGIESDSVMVNIVKNFRIEPTWHKKKYLGEEMVLFEGSFKKPASMIFEVRAEQSYAGTGFVVSPEKFKPATVLPKDFDKYWEKEKLDLRSLPIEVKSTKVENVETGFICTDVEINCIGSKPARGYFAKPDNVEFGTLPIVLNLHAAGVKGDWCLSKPSIAIKYAKKGNGALAFDLNAHGMLNGQPQEYYDDLEKGELKNYWEIGLEKREEYYFRGMYLRLVRTLDFLCSQPEWDGERIIVIGESQGGGQALAAAGLDDRVTAVVTTVPAMCDFGRDLIREKGGWPNPFRYQKNKEKIMKSIPYFDAAHLLKNSKATLVTEIGLIDFTCPSAGIFAAINQAKGEKITLVVPYRGHHQNQPTFQKEWEKEVYKTKMDFIDEFLK